VAGDKSGEGEKEKNQNPLRPNRGDDYLRKALSSTPGVSSERSGATCTPGLGHDGPSFRVRGLQRAVVSRVEEALESRKVVPVNRGLPPPRRYEFLPGDCGCERLEQEQRETALGGV